MKKVLIAALAAVALVSGFTEAWAGPLFSKQVQLVWIRSTGSTDGQNGVYLTSLSNGVHGNAAGVAPSATTRDTSVAIDVRDHWTNYRRSLAAGPNGGVAGSLVQDTLAFFGTIHLQSTRSFIDSVTIVRQWSLDGMKWTTADSLGGHAFVPDSTTLSASSAVTDSVRLLNSLPGVQIGAVGNQGRVANYAWTCNPWMGINDVTAQATIGFNFIRFIITQSNGDYVGSGLSDGWSGWFSYLAVEPNFSR